MIEVRSTYLISMYYLTNILLVQQSFILRFQNLFKFILQIHFIKLSTQYSMLLIYPFIRSCVLNLVQNQMLKLTLEELVCSLLPDNKNQAIYQISSFDMVRGKFYIYLEQLYLPFQLIYSSLSISSSLQFELMCPKWKKLGGYVIEIKQL